MGARVTAGTVEPLALIAGGREGVSPVARARAVDGDEALIAALHRQEPWARTALVQKYHQRVERIVAGALGIDSELADVVQEVFLRVLCNIQQLKDPAALPSWISSLAVFTARGLIRKRQRWRWIRFLAPEDVPEAPTPGHDHEGAATMRAVYATIDTLPADERIAFTLRFVSGLELTEIAAACRVSLATIKRRLSRAEARFATAAASSPLLRHRLRASGRFAVAGLGDADDENQADDTSMLGKKGRGP